MHGLKPLKYKKGKTILIAFVKIVNKSNHKLSKSWIDQGRKVFNKLMQEIFIKNDR